MKPLAEYMASYAAYHRDPRTKLTHFLGVPAIIFAILVPMAAVRSVVAGVEVSLAAVFVVTALGWYLMLDRTVGVTLAVLTAPLLWAAEVVARQPVPVSLSIFLIFFVGGWLVQLLGHRFEGNRPALLDNLFQTFVAPAFLAAELLFAVGLKHELHEEVERRMTEGEVH